MNSRVSEEPLKSRKMLVYTAIKVSWLRSADGAVGVVSCGPVKALVSQFRGEGGRSFSRRGGAPTTYSGGRGDETRCSGCWWEIYTTQPFGLTISKLVGNADTSNAIVYFKSTYSNIREINISLINKVKTKNYKGFCKLVASHIHESTCITHLN